MARGWKPNQASTIAVVPRGLAAISAKMAR